MKSIIKTSKENICFEGSEYVFHEAVTYGGDIPTYQLKIYFKSGTRTVTCWLSYDEAVSLSNEIGELMKEFKRGEEAVKKRKTFQERLDEEQAKRKYADMLKEKLDIDEQAAEAAAKQAYDLKQHDHQRTREIEEEVMKNQKPKAEINTIEQELILEKIDILKDYFFHAYKIYQTIGKDDFLFAKNILWALAKKIKLPNVNENIASFVPIECLDNLVEFIENTIDTIKSSEGPVSKYEIEKVLGTFTYTAKSIIESSYPNYLIDYLAWGNRKDIHQGGNSGDENAKEEESSKKQKPKAYTLDEVKDEMIGEKGTTERDKYEKRLLINLFAEKVAEIISEYNPNYRVIDNGRIHNIKLDMPDLINNILALRDKFLEEIDAEATCDKFNKQDESVALGK